MNFEPNKALWNRIKELEGYFIDNREVYKSVSKVLTSFKLSIEKFVENLNTHGDDLDGLLVRMEKLPDMMMMRWAFWCNFCLGI